MRYQVDRHSGRTAGIWRVLLRTEDEAQARQRYADTAKALRQGTVRLMVDGQLASSTSAPRLRSRW